MLKKRIQIVRPDTRLMDNIPWMVRSDTRLLVHKSVLRNFDITRILNNIIKQRRNKKTWETCRATKSMGFA